MTSLLSAYWSELSATHDAVTADVMRGRYIVNAALAGEATADLQRRWDSHMVEQARRAIRDNPDKTILILGSYRKRHAFLDELAAGYPERVVDMEQWLACD